MGETEIDLDDVLLSIRVVAAWHVHAAKVAEQYAATRRAKILPIGDVPDERAKILPSGELVVYVPASASLPEVSMVIPASDWQRRR